MALVNKRIIDLPERSALNSDDYTVIDGDTGGTAKYKLASMGGDVDALKQTVDLHGAQIATITEDVNTNTQDIADLKEDLSQKAPAIYNASDEAKVVTFSDGADDMPMKSVVLKLVPHQEGSGDPSPSNVRQISGYTAVNVTRAGKNLLPATVDGIKKSATAASWNGNVGTQSGVTFTLMQDGKGNLESIVLNGTATGNIQFFLAKGFSLTGNYILSGGKSGSVSVAVGGKGESTGGDKSYTDDGTSRNSWIYVANGTVCNNVAIKPMIRSASIADGTYEPFVESTTYPITLPQTVFSGELDVVSGTLTIDYRTTAISDITCGHSGDYFYATPTGKKAGITNIIAEAYQTSDAQSVSQMPDYSIKGHGGTSNIYLKDSRYSDAQSFVGAMGSYKISYELATPIEITLDKTTITTLLGSNTIWMDADGTIQCDYPADTKLYIDALTAPDDDMIANTNIASGKYFTVNNKLYISTSAIAQGEAIIVGTNCTQTDLATALNALNS